MDVVFTGTRNGTTPEQAGSIATALRELRELKDLHHGACVGADEHFHLLGTESRAKDIYIYPAFKPGHAMRAVCHNSIDYWQLMNMPMPIDPLYRNRYMLKTVNDRKEDCILIACPRGNREELRSGTWATIRYARKIGMRVGIIWPDGVVFNDR